MKNIAIKTSLILAVIVVVSISAFAQELHWQYSTRGNLPQTTVVDNRRDNFIYVAQKAGGVLVLETTGQKRSPKKAATLLKRQFSNLDAIDITQQGKYLYVALGDFFRRNTRAGLAIVDVSNPKRPIVTARWRSRTRLHGAATIEVEGNFAYLGAMEHGVFIFDVSNKRRITEIKNFKLDRNFPKRNPNRIQEPNARGLAVRGKYLYVANDAGGLRVVDISNKRNPREIAKHIIRKRGLKQQAYNNIAINFPYAYIALDYCGMEIVNIQNPRNIKHVGWWNPWRCNTNSNNWFNSSGHTNQIYFEKRTNQVFLSAGDSELQVVDVSNPRRPRLKTSFGKPKNNQGVWGVTVTKEMIYLTYIRTFIPFRGTWSGIKALSR